MTTATLPLSASMRRVALTRQPLVRAAIAVVLALTCMAFLIALSGKNPIIAYQALFFGAFGSVDRVAFALNKATPYLLAGIGIALCFRAKIINIGGEGQIAIGGLAATWAALAFPVADPAAAIVLALAAATAGGALWAGVATVIHLSRRVHEVLVTLLLNFVALLIVGEALHGPLGEVGAGFPQSPLLPATAWLPKLWPRTQLHIGIAMAVVAAVVAYVLLWRTTFGFALRVAGASRPAALYAGFSVPRVPV
jgi:general nucleoside transport system permease protein